jgi:hypothetical protein
MCVSIDSPSAPTGLRYFSTRDFKFKVHALAKILLSKVEKYRYSPIAEKESVSPKIDHIGGVI